MRLTKLEVDAIKNSFKEIFKEGRIFLFGSRTNDSLKGGDIDLYIITEKNDRLMHLKIEFLVHLKRKIGNQKIDVVISKDISRPIEQEALSKGIEL